MKVQIISRDDITEGLIYDLLKENVKVYYKGKNRYVFKGFDNFEFVDDYIGDVDYYIFDDTMFGIQIEYMRKKGYDVVGGNIYGDKLELDRDFFFREMERIGVKVPKSHPFETIDEGIDWLKENDGRYVFKPSGQISDEKSLTYVSKDRDDLIEFMQWVKRKYGNSIKYVLQEFVEGLEVAISGIVIDGKVVGGYFVNFEYKPFMKYSNFNTGEMGTVIVHYDDVGDLSDTFDKVVSELGEYRGWFDLNGILTDDGWYLLEPTSRFGVPFFAIAHSMIDMPKGEMYEQIAKGELRDLKVKDGVFVGIVLAVPPFPYHIPNQWDISQNPIREGLFDDSDVHYFEIMKKDGEYWTSGDAGYVAVVVGHGENSYEANRNAVRKLRQIAIPNSFFRFDIGWDMRYESFKYYFDRREYGNDNEKSD